MIEDEETTTTVIENEETTTTNDEETTANDIETTTVEVATVENTEVGLAELTEIVATVSEASDDLFGAAGDTCWYLEGTSPNYTLHLSATENAGYATADVDKKGQFRKVENYDDQGWDSEKTNITSVVIDNEITPLEYESYV